MFQGFPKKDFDITDSDEEIDITGSDEDDTDDEYCWVGRTRGAKKTEAARTSDNLTGIMAKRCNIRDKISFKLSQKTLTPQTKTVEPQENSLLKEKDTSIQPSIEKTNQSVLPKEEAEKPHIPISMPPPSMEPASSTPSSPPEVINTQNSEANRSQGHDKVLNSKSGFTGLNHPFEVKFLPLFECDPNRDSKPCQGQAPDSVFNSRRFCTPLKDAVFGPGHNRPLTQFKFTKFDTPEGRADLERLKKHCALVSSQVTPPNSGSDSQRDQNPSQVNTANSKSDPKGDSNPSQINLHLRKPDGSEDKTLTKSSEADNSTKSSHDEHIIDDDNRSFLMSLLPLISSFNENQKLQFRADTYNLILKIKNSPAPSPHQWNQLFTNNILPPTYSVGLDSAPAYQTQSNMSATSSTYRTPSANGSLRPAMPTMDFTDPFGTSTSGSSSTHPTLLNQQNFNSEANKILPSNEMDSPSQVNPHVHVVSSPDTNNMSAPRSHMAQPSMTGASSYTSAPKACAFPTTFTDPVHLKPPRSYKTSLAEILYSETKSLGLTAMPKSWPFSVSDQLMAETVSYH